MEGSVKCLEESVKKIKIRKLLSKLCQDLFFWWGKLVTNPFEFFFKKKRLFSFWGVFYFFFFYFLMMLLWFVLEIFIHFNLCSFKPIMVGFTFEEVLVLFLAIHFPALTKEQSVLECTFKIHFVMIAC